MTRTHNFLSIIAAATLLSIAGCGGGGIDDALTDPNGAFSMSLSPSRPGDLPTSGVRIDAEFEVENGEISAGFVQYIDSNPRGYSSTSVVGEASNGHIHAQANFPEFEITIDAEYGAFGWNGTYRVGQKMATLEEGEFTMSRRPETANVAGNWAGNITKAGDTEYDLTFALEMKGNTVGGPGTFFSGPVFGLGSIVGDSIYLNLEPDVDAGYPSLVGTVDETGTTISGYLDGGTFVLHRVLMKPGAPSR